MKSDRSDSTHTVPIPAGDVVSSKYLAFRRGRQSTVRVTAKMLRAGDAAVVANRWHPLPIDILKAIYLAMEAARAK